MSKRRGSALFVGLQPFGVVIAKGSNSTPPIHIESLESYEIQAHDIETSPLAMIAHHCQEKKTLTESQFLVSHEDFFNILHEVELLAKAKATNYFPNVVKTFLENDDDAFYHVLNNSDGEPYSPDNVSEKQLIISGMKVNDLIQLQNQITQNGFYPTQLQCNTLATVGLLKKLLCEDESPAPILMLEVFHKHSLLIIIPPKGKIVIRKIPSGILAVCEQIKDEFGLKDILSSQKLLYSTTIDLSDIGRQIINTIFQEMTASIGMFEVETGQSVRKMFVPNLPKNLSWISELLARDLGMDLFHPNHDEILEKLEIQVNDGVNWDKTDARFLPLFASMGIL